MTSSPEEELRVFGLRGKGRVVEHHEANEFAVRMDRAEPRRVSEMGLGNRYGVWRNLRAAVAGVQLADGDDSVARDLPQLNVHHEAGLPGLR
jgi:hypothetical protein